MNTGSVGCVPCVTLGRWLEKHKSLVERDYVVVKIDISQDLHGEKLNGELLDGVNSGAPYHAIFNSDGARLIDSIGPNGNIGFPSNAKDIEYFRKMISTTANKLSSSEIETLIKTLEES